MRLIYDLIQSIAWTASGGVFVTDSAALTNRSPQAVTRMTWPSGAQTTATTCALQAGFTAQRLIGGALLATTLPVGLKIEVRGKRPIDADYTYPLGGDALTQRTVALPGGGIGCVWSFDLGLDPISGLQIKCYNDVGGSISLGAGASFDIGEIALGNGIQCEHETGWTLDGKDPSKTQRTLGSQDSRVQRPGYRIITVTPTLASSAEWLAGGLDGWTDWQTIAAALRADDKVLLIVDTSTTEAAQRTGIFGAVTRIPSGASAPGPYYTPNEITVEEIPA